MFYHLAGSISGFFVFLSLFGVIAQLRLLLARKKQYEMGDLSGERPSDVLSLNRFFTSFLAFFSVFLYGLTLSHFDHYLVWPRLIVMAALLWILYEIKIDRKSRRSVLIFYSGVGFLLGAFVLGLTSYRSLVFQVGMPHVFILIALFLFVQGAVHQIVMIRRARKMGGLSIQMYQFYLLKDISSLAYAISMGLAVAWPLLLFYSVSSCVQMISLYHFRWARLLKERA